MSALNENLCLSVFRRIGGLENTVQSGETLWSVFRRIGGLEMMALGEFWSCFLQDLTDRGTWILVHKYDIIYASVEICG